MSQRRLWRVRVGGLAVAAVLAASVMVAGPSAAVGEAVSSTNTVGVLPSTTTTLSGITLTNFSGTQLVSVSASQGTLTLPSTTGLSMSAGYTSSGQSLSFTGVQSDVNAALAQITYNAGASLGTATVTVSVVPNSTGLSYNPDNNHFYKYVASPAISWTAARAAASSSTYLGLPGYLASATSSAENAFITSKSGGSDIWIGGIDTTLGVQSTRSWSWVDDPSSTAVFTTCSTMTTSTTCSTAGGQYTNWNPGEPNNSGTEYVMETNVGGQNGLWNDLPPASSTAAGYVVEYGTSSAGGGFGSSVSSATSSVLVTNAPGPVTSPVIGAIGNGANLTFTAPSTGAPVTGYQYSVNGGTTWLSLQIVGTAGTQRTALIQGLTAGTSYNVLVRATSSVSPGTTVGPLSVTPTSGSAGGGMTTPTPTTTPSPSASPSPGVTPTAPPQAAPVPVVAPIPAATSAALTFTQPTASGVVSGYQYRLNNGSWRALTVTTDSSGQVSATVPGLEQATSYAIDIRAVNSLGAGPVTSLTVTTELDTSWYRDPLGAGARASLIKIPSNPKAYDGKLAYTAARYTSYAGKKVVPVATLAKRPIVTGQGALVSGSKLFRADKSGKLVLTAKGKVQAQALAKSLRLDASIRCEGYTDYAGSTAKQKAVASARAQAICAALDAYTTGTSVKAVSYGAKRPVVVGGSAAKRGANYRIVVMVTKTKS